MSFYKDAGVNIENGYKLVEQIKPIAKRTSINGVLNGLGGFSSLFEIPINEYKNPVLVSSTDGVGTKLKLAIETNCYDGIGIDLVAMCVNDIICQGARPLYFLDYFATSKLDVNVASRVIDSIGTGCEIAGIALVGGETAEMPGIYHNNDIDLAGFSVGIVEKDKIIDGSTIKDGDVLIGLHSNGLHSNGFSFIRKMIKDNNIDINSYMLNNVKFSQFLLQPTKIYVNIIHKLIEHFTIKGIAHITGGGLTENIARIMPNGYNALIDFRHYNLPGNIYDLIFSLTNITFEEIFNTFNCGIGMVVCVSQNDVDEICTSLKLDDAKYTIIGDVIKSKKIIYNY